MSILGCILGFFRSIFRWLRHCIIPFIILMQSVIKEICDPFIIDIGLRRLKELTWVLQIKWWLSADLLRMQQLLRC